MSNKVLIVEDEFIVANDLRIILKKAGYSVNGIASSIEEALESLEKIRPDIVILDIQLQGILSGIDFGRKLKEENIAFIYLSAFSDQKTLEQAKTTDPYGFLVKPFRQKDLLIAMDIARYRHKYSFESKIRQEEFLQNQILDVLEEASEPREKFLKISRIIQSDVPFDLVVLSYKPASLDQLSDVCYLRTGYDEYQYIGQNELMTITGLTKAEILKLIQLNELDRHAIIHNTPSEINKESLHKILMETFKLESCLGFPLSLNSGYPAHLYFFSKKPSIYNKEHIRLLYRLEKSLINMFHFLFDLNSDVSTLKREPVRSAKNLGITSNGFKDIIGSHHLLLSALDLVKQVAAYNTSVLILGESGTGKEKVAKAIHDLSPRKNGPFIKINCAAIPPALVESELFGHEKGSFTGAIEKRKGKFENANGGTIFLDEIGELPLEMQVKLLRVLQEKEIEYVGSSTSIKVDVRIVAATNRNLEKEVALGKFRTDLYYRLNVFPITIPALRERKSDIRALSLFFAEKFSKEFNKPFHGISESMLNEMTAYNWPGNIRELVNVLEQAFVLNDGNSQLILTRKLSSQESEDTIPVNANTLEDVKIIQRETEKNYIISILKKSNGRIRGTNGASALLNIKPTTLESRMAKLGINKEDYSSSSDNT